MPTKTSPARTAAAEKITKQAAKKKQITIELSPKQLKALTAQYQKLNPSEAAELVFKVSNKAISRLKIAGYSYHGDTCCV